MMRTMGVVAIAGLACAGQVLAGDEYNNDEQCPIPTSGADVTLCEAYGLQQDTRQGTISGLTVGTTSWNVGTERLDWFQSPAENHPFITANIYR